MRISVSTASIFAKNLADDDGTPLEKKMWPKNATKLLRLGVPLDDIKPFDGKPG